MKNKMIKSIFTIFLVIFITGKIFAGDIKDDNYKFQISIPSGWTNPVVEETAKKDAVSYSLSRSDDKSAILILAFKVNSIKDLSDFVWTIEKDVTMNIPQKGSEVYVQFDRGDYDGMQMNYSDNEFTESIYYYRTKYTDTNANFAYVVRFITPKSAMNFDIESEIKKISDSFKPIR